jgi:4'-phosphopantetheinyl transferase
MQTAQGSAGSGGQDAPEMVTVSISGLASLVEAGGPGDAAERRLQAWLRPAERLLYESFSVPKRRRDWLAGRIAAKDLLCGRHGLRGPDRFLDIEISAEKGGPAHGRPFYCLGGQPGRYGLSLSHSGDTAVAALGRHAGQWIGVDHEAVAPRDPSFETLALSEAELRRLGGLRGEARARAVTHCWVLKEALLKALGTGLRVPLPMLTTNLDPDRDELADRPFAAHPDAPAPIDRLDPALLVARLFRLGDQVAAWVTYHPSEKK